MAKTSSSPVAAPTSLLLPSGLLHLLPCFAVLFLFLKWTTRALLSFLWLHTAHIYWSPDDVHYDYYNYRSKPPPSSLYQNLRISRYGLRSRRRVDSSCDMDIAAEYCVVCLTEMRDGDEVRELRCNHMFHRACLDLWVEHGKATCPLCRSALASAAAAAEPIVQDAATNVTSAGGDGVTEVEMSEDGEISSSELLCLLSLTGRWVG